MIALNRPDLKLLLLTIATFVALTLAAPDAFAGSDVKRSAGSMKHSTGSGAKSGTSMRTSSRSGPKLPSDGKRKKDDDKKKATKYKFDSDGYPVPGREPLAAGEFPRQIERC